MVESSAPRSTTGFFRVPGLFVRLSSKALSNTNGVDPDSVWSPTSPLDLKSNLRSSPPRVGLGLVDALTADAGSLLFGGGKSSFLDSIRPFLELGGLPKPPPAVAAAFGKGAAAAPADEVASGHADDEEYTCVIARGANPRTTHIVGGETVEVRGGGCPAGGCAAGKVVFTVEPFASRLSPAATASPAGVASGRCRCCMKRLPENMDIFIYKGEKAFCSNECREGYIEEEVEDAQDILSLDHGSSTAFFLGEDW
ncbi:hypothetical protein PR202_ga09864 [Eleusine coracana subsp. coracana]|uniref:FLZ-type domain-containing protein n=1 Tax=Eleusine coracana subsp. coracana TaxID=191504 RepID=A0AAV5C4U9_ELECO|nr:hypothetical protein QOZ80_1AG0031280 [Eleusine coracana subsp. coracana]GJM93317.1 hypothetical protein PR202_ga09864 [Eleusine coracana subsp. coracana]